MSNKLYHATLAIVDAKCYRSLHKDLDSSENFHPPLVQASALRRSNAMLEVLMPRTKLWPLTVRGLCGSLPLGTND